MTPLEQIIGELKIKESQLVLEIEICEKELLEKRPALDYVRRCIELHENLTGLKEREKNDRLRAIGMDIPSEIISQYISCEVGISAFSPTAAMMHVDTTTQPESEPEPQAKQKPLPTCKNCGNVFIPSKFGGYKQLFCNRLCKVDFDKKKAQAEKDAKYKPFVRKPKAKPTPMNTETVANFKAKLDEIKRTCPTPTKRPNIQREL